MVVEVEEKEEEEEEGRKQDHVSLRPGETCSMIPYRKLPYIYTSERMMRPEKKRRINRH